MSLVLPLLSAPGRKWSGLWLVALLMEPQLPQPSAAHLLSAASRQEWELTVMKNAHRGKWTSGQKGGCLECFQHSLETWKNSPTCQGWLGTQSSVSRGWLWKIPAPDGEGLSTSNNSRRQHSSAQLVPSSLLPSPPSSLRADCSFFGLLM